MGLRMVRVEGLEPPRLAAPEPKSGASTNFATPALCGLLAKPVRGCERKLQPEVAKHLWQHFRQVFGNKPRPKGPRRLHMQPRPRLCRLHRLKSPCQ